MTTRVWYPQLAHGENETGNCLRRQCLWGYPAAFEVRCAGGSAGVEKYTCLFSGVYIYIHSLHIMSYHRFVCVHFMPDMPDLVPLLRSLRPRSINTFWEKSQLLSWLPESSVCETMSHRIQQTRIRRPKLLVLLPDMNPCLRNGSLTESIPEIRRPTSLAT